MPSEVRAVINLRLLHPWTVEKAIGFIKKAIADERVNIKIHGLGTDPVPAKAEYAGRTGPGWKEMEAALGAVYPGVPILVFIMVATTDSRHYRDLAGGIFRFSPHRLSPREMSLIHGHDERISVENLRRGFEFYSRLLGSL
jgi:carboxypeptidase PM20D1